MRAASGRERGAAARRLRRGGLGLCALAVLFGPIVASGCQPGFDPPSKVDGLRVIGVVADEPYAKPGDSVTFTMSYEDGLDPAHPRDIKIFWLGGCFDPEGDLYYGCYPQLGPTFQALESVVKEHKPPPPQLAAYLGLGPTFTLKLPADIASQRPPGADGTREGTAFVFFVACAGEIRGVGATGTGRAGDFPVGCFDANGNPLGADSFVPGYTQIFAFDDGRTNANPELDGITYDGNNLADDPTKAPTVPRCVLTDDQRRQQGCGRVDPTKTCTEYAISVTAPRGVAEPDPTATTADGSKMSEAVWVDYYADGGDLSGDAALVSDATSGYKDDHSVKWLPPSTPGLVSIWATLHDNRGGTTVGRRYVRVE